MCSMRGGVGDLGFVLGAWEWGDGLDFLGRGGVWEWGLAGGFMLGG